MKRQRKLKRFRGSRNASKFARKDVISTMPEEVITKILHCLPVQDAVKTSILSRDWKYKWTMLTRLVFDVHFYRYIEMREMTVQEYISIISRLLYHLKGAITKFVLYLPQNNHVDVDVINNWVIFLSKKGIKELTLANKGGDLPELTSHLFSCEELIHLELDNWKLCPASELCGFPNLLSLDISNLRFGSYKNFEFLTRSPLLEILKLFCTDEVKQADIVKHENLKVLYLHLNKIENMKMITSSGIFQLIGSFPSLQKLNLDFMKCKLLADAENSDPASLPCLKTLQLGCIDFKCDTMVSCAIELICSSPNLKNLSVVAIYDYGVPLPAVDSSEVDFNRVGQLQLLKVELFGIRGLKNEVRLIKYLLDRSPSLKKMTICAVSSKMLGGEDGERKFTTKLLKLRRASPLAKIHIEWL